MGSAIWFIWGCVTWIVMILCAETIARAIREGRDDER